MRRKGPPPASMKAGQAAADAAPACGFAGGAAASVAGVLPDIVGGIGAVGALATGGRFGGEMVQGAEQARKSLDSCRNSSEGARLGGDVADVGIAAARGGPLGAAGAVASKVADATGVKARIKAHFSP